jgi:hypothetical protein
MTDSLSRTLPLIRDNPDGTRTQLDFYTMDEVDEAVDFINRHNLEYPDWNRTGNCICQHCGNEYGFHRSAWPWLFLHRICDGSYVKL